MSVPGAFRAQGRACARLGSPFMARLMEVLAGLWDDDSALGRRWAGYPGDLGPGGASLPLRVAGGLHALHLRGCDAGLSAVYPPAESSDSDLREAVAAALTRHAGFLLRFTEQAPQTNEVRRAAVLVSAAHWLAERHPRPIVLSELGASGGLNLGFDRFALQIGDRRYGPPEAVLTLAPEWTGPHPPGGAITVSERRGADIAPIDAGSEEGRLRLLAYLWADQPDRLARTRAALAAHDAAVDAADAAAWLETRLDTPRPGRLHLVYHTIAWQYFPEATQARARTALERAGERATGDAPLAWLSMEADGQPESAALALRLWPGGRCVPLGRADFHGRWIAWEGPRHLP
ncbi:DUF2332 domain-containing protein [Rhodosalinus halophilus]|uniref:DUF2332 domain-containing protein n=1 Tax=Rhodosalinus halophilus TaxID=2259333 RepID=A0A365U6R7_9RHOB|nr:DUF2332 family protein [Rhodosalinus halophilus]RBI84299.1 DUF2332 domain-containing protein [Rhodosalinus halophilus]